MAKLLFDVVLCDANNQPVMANLRGVPMDEAIKASMGWNEDRDKGLVAVVTMAGTVAIELEARERDSNALAEQDDSEVEDTSEDAAESNVVDEICERRAKFVQRELRRHLKRIWNAVPHVTDGADLGIVAASLESVARAVDGVPEDEITYERFAYALHGDMRYTELEEALGVVR